VNSIEYNTHMQGDGSCFITFYTTNFRQKPNFSPETSAETFRLGGRWILGGLTGAPRGREVKVEILKYGDGWHAVCYPPRPGSPEGSVVVDMNRRLV